MRRGKHSKRLFGGGRLPVVLVVAGAVLLLGGGSSFAAYRYDRAASSRIMPGVSIAGVDLSGMTRDEAVRQVSEVADETLSSRLVVTAAGTSWNVTPGGLGVHADVEDAVGEAFAVADSLSFLYRVYHRVMDNPVERSVALGYDYDRAAVEAFVQQAYQEVSKPAVDAEIALVDGKLVMHRARAGRTLKTELGTNRILAALERHVEVVTIPVKVVEPAVTNAQLGYTIVIRLSENQLYVYKGMKLDRTYPIATGSPGFPTPRGSFEIVDKTENPSWTNPDPTGWGAGLPAYIPPGPGNPLGTRAMYLDAPGIRIHGTYDLGSIGTYASHGCIRMTIADSEELYSFIPVGTSVLILW